MLDAPAIVRAASPLLERGIPFLVATVVRIRGSSYRRPGARLLATAEGRVAGNVSGGCLERDLIRTGLWRTRNGPVVLRYDSTDPDGSDAVLGCGGVVDVLLEQGRGGDGDHPLALMARVLEAERRDVMATVFGSTDPKVPLGTRLLASAIPRAEDAPLAERIFSADSAPSRSIETHGGTIDVLVETIVPPPHLFVLGAGLDALPLVLAARQIGWSVTVWSVSPSFAGRARFEAAGAAVQSDLDKIRTRIDASDRAMAVVMGHNLGHDRAALGMAIASRAQYIGILGPRHRTASLVEDFPARIEDPRIHAPVGLDLGAETPDEVAIAITAEMLAHLRGGSGASLRHKSTIHG